MKQAAASEWLRFAVYVPAFGVLTLAVLEGWKLIREVNAAIPGQEHYRYWGRDPVRAWERHETLFPERGALRRRIRWLYLGSFGLVAVASAWILLWK
jgi:hypothetical protein